MKAVVVFLIIMFMGSTVVAHSGGTDQYGCHTNSSTGVYHCHNSGSGGGSGEDLDINWPLVAGVVIGGGLLAWFILDSGSSVYAESNESDRSPFRVYPAGDPMDNSSKMVLEYQF